MTQDRTPLDAATEDALWRACERLGDDALPGEMSDADIVAGALAGIDSGIPSPTAEPAAPRRRWAPVVAIAFAGGAIAAALLLLILSPGVSSWFTTEDGDTPSLAPSVADDPENEGDAAIRGNNPLHGKAKHAKARHAGAESADADPSADANADADADATADPAADDNVDVDVDVDADVDVDTDASAAAADDVRNRGHRRGSRAHRAPSNKTDAAGLLTEARAHLKAGDKKAAMSTYRTLQRRFAGTPEAAAALVSMGRVELSRGRAKAALRYFDTYLSSSAGVLRQEARYNRIRALRLLGRSAQEKASIKAFLADHVGKSVYTSRLRKRLTELEQQ